MFMKLPLYVPDPGFRSQRRARATYTCTWKWVIFISINYYNKQKYSRHGPRIKVPLVIPLLQNTSIHVHLYTYAICIAEYRVDDRSFCIIPTNLYRGHICKHRSNGVWFYFTDTMSPV